MKPLPTYEEVSARLDYNPDTGILIWKNGPRKGQVTGKSGTKRYFHISYPKGGGMYYKLYVHRLAWLLTYKTWPVFEIDHINGDTYDNRIVNLQDVPRSENLRNRRINRINVTGFKGVVFVKRLNRFLARMSVNNKQKYLGIYTSPEKAHAAYCNAVKEYQRACKAKMTVSFGLTCAE